MLLAVSNAVSKKFRKSSDNKVSSRWRQQDMPDVRLTRTSDDNDDDDDDDDGVFDASRHYYVPSPRRNKPQPEQSSPRDESSVSMEGSKRLADGPAAGSTSSRRATRLANLSSSHDCLASSVHKRYGHRASLNEDQYDDQRRWSDTMSPPTSTKPILAVDRCHDCSTESIRNLVKDSRGQPSGDRRAGRSAEVLLGVDSEDVTSSRRSVRFAEVVCVCDQTSNITFCNLRQYSASSAPAALGGKRGGDSGGRSCSLPALSSGGCVGSGGSHSGDRCDDELPAIVERYMARRGRQRQYCDDSDEVHRFPPLRHRRT